MTKEIERLHPGSEFSAIVCARSDLMKQLDKIQNPKFKRYDWLSSLEKKWLETPLNKEKLAKYERLLGTESLRRILIADREIGAGYVSCGIVERTKLIDLTIHNDDARWRYIIGLVDYFYTMFEKDRPDITFAYCVAGAVAMAMGEVARHLGILFTQPVFTRIGHYHIIDNNPYSLFSEVKKTYTTAMKFPDTLSEFLPKAKDFLQTFRNKPQKPQDTLTWIAIILKNTAIKGIAKTIVIDLARWGAIVLGLKGTRGVLRQRLGLEILKFNLANTLALRKIAKKKHKCFSYNLPMGDYIYYPLHVDPEASTMVLSPHHTDQVSIIEAISKNMPAGMKLCVKEHLPCAGKRPKGFYERIRNIPGVELLSPFLDNFAIINNTALIATITGSTGLEAIMLGKPVIVFGDVHYQIAEKGFVHHPNISVGLDKAIHFALSLSPAPEKNLTTYIASIMKEGIELSPDDLWFEHLSDLSKREQAMGLIVNKILSMHEKISKYI